MAGPDGTKVERMSPPGGGVLPPISRRVVTPHRRRAVRRTFVALAATLALLALADTVLWRVAISWLRERSGGWQAQRRAAGWTLTAGRRRAAAAMGGPARPPRPGAHRRSGGPAGRGGLAG